MNSLELQFNTFDRQNPHVYVLFRHFTMQAIKAGMKKIAVALIIERIRWETVIETQGDGFKINNNHRAYYARKFMREHAALGNVFNTRATKDD